MKQPHNPITRIRELLELESFDGCFGLIEPIEKLISERDDACKNALAFSTELNELMADELLDRLGLEEGYTPAQFHASMKTLFDERDALTTDLRTLRDKFYNLEAKHNELLATQPQLSEIRYVLHGDIQPCTVLYSDESTTLLRLDEGDIMCETDAIEWSDSVTYRCQELLREARVEAGANRVNLDAAKLFAQLVRDERILLNDNGDDVVKQEEFGSVETDEGAHTVCTQCDRVFFACLDLCPQCHTPKQER